MVPRTDSADRAPSLRARSNGAGARRLALHLLALAATGAAHAQAGGMLAAGAFLAYAIVLAFLFAPLHESIHRSAFRSRWCNELVARVCGFVLLLPAGYFRAFHLAHHRHTQDPASDPELASPRPARLWPCLAHLSGLPYWGERAGSLLRHAGGRVDEPFIAAARRRGVCLEARVHLASYLLLGLAAAFGAAPALWQFWVAPALAGMPFLRAFLLAEHAGCPQVAQMHRNSRTIHSNGLLRLLCWNMNYHTAHHCEPAVPFHRLPRLHRLLHPPPAEQTRGYWRFHRAWLGRALSGARVPAA